MSGGLARPAATRDPWSAFPPGHFYSPLPDLAEVRRRGDPLLGDPRRALPGLDLDEAGQLEWLERLAALYPEHPFTEERRSGARYRFHNPAFGYADALALYAMMRTLRPGRIVEVGSGWSSAAMLDVDERFALGVDFTFVEPYPDLLVSLLKEEDLQRITLHPQPVQEVGLEVFSALEENDILFIDSTHVSKTGSDVNRLFFEVLPALRPGVHVHVHDIFHPFEYPLAWLEEGRAWNEAYLLRAFLAFNSAFKVTLFGSFLLRFHAERIAARMPLFPRNGAGSVWLRRER